MAKKKDDDKKKKSTSKKKNNPPKKRRVGRPKKRGRKKKYYKPVKKKKKKTAQSGKGFGSNTSYNRVRALLWKKHKDDFSSYREFISNKVDEKGKKIKGSSPVSQIYNECKSLDCSDEDIISIYNQSKRQDKEGDPPILPEDYYEPRPYFELVTVDLWDGMDERLWVVAPMLIINPDFFLGILGEDRCIDKDNQIKDSDKCDPKKGDKIVNGKKDRFMPFVTFCNQFQHLKIFETTEEVPHFKFIGENETEIQPYWSNENNRWEIQIVPCTPFGDVDSYGFDPVSEEQIIPDEEDLPEIGKPKEEVEIEKPSEVDKKITLEKERQKTLAQEEKTAIAKAKVEEKKAIADITAQWRQKEISTKEMKELIQLIKS